MRMLTKKITDGIPFLVHNSLDDLDLKSLIILIFIVKRQKTSHCVAHRITFTKKYI